MSTGDGRRRVHQPYTLLPTSPQTPSARPRASFTPQPPTTSPHSYSQQAHWTSPSYSGSGGIAVDVLEHSLGVVQSATYNPTQSQPDPQPQEREVFHWSPPPPHAPASTVSCMTLLRQALGNSTDSYLPHHHHCHRPPAHSMPLLPPAGQGVHSAPANIASSGGLGLDWVAKFHALHSLHSQGAASGASASGASPSNPAAAVPRNVGTNTTSDCRGQTKELPSFSNSSSSLPLSSTIPLLLPYSASSTNGRSGYFPAPTQLFRQAGATSGIERDQPLQPIQPCTHVQAKRLRSKKGFGHYVCSTCGARWKVPNYAHVYERDRKEQASKQAAAPIAIAIATRPLHVLTLTAANAGALDTQCRYSEVGTDYYYFPHTEVLSFSFVRESFCALLLSLCVFFCRGKIC